MAVFIATGRSSGIAIDRLTRSRFDFFRSRSVGSFDLFLPLTEELTQVHLGYDLDVGKGSSQTKVRLDILFRAHLIQYGRYCGNQTSYWSYSKPGCICHNIEEKQRSEGRKCL